MTFHRIPDGLTFFSPSVLLATWFGTGLIRPASGSWGSLGGFIIGLMFLQYFPSTMLIIAAGFIYFIGLWACRVWLLHAQLADSENSEHADPQAIVIDEVAGLWLALAMAPQTLTGYVAAFILFRFFDITKIWPASWADQKLHGAHGIMLDDIIAGCWAVIILLIARAFQLI